MRLLLLVGLLGCVLLPNRALASELSYEFQPLPTGSQPELRVTLRFRGNPSGKTTILLPSEWGGQDRLFRCIHDLKPVVPGVRLEKGEREHERIFHHTPNQLLSLEYRVQQDIPNPLADLRYYRPILQTNYFQLIGYAFLVLPDGPEWDERALRNVKMEWKELPKGWRLVTSFGVDQTSQEVTQSFLGLRQAIFAGGDFRAHRFFVKGKPVSVAIRGSWKFSDFQAVSLLEKIVVAQRTFWNDFDFPYYLVTLIPTAAPCCGYGGTGLTNAFATFAAADTEIERDLTYLFSHELFHAWNGIKIDREQPEELVYWFSEGMTDYYTELLNLRAGLISLERYIDDYNEFLRQYFLSPVRNVTNREVKARFFQDKWVQKIPYRRGDILAHNWNAQIQARSQNKASFDNAMWDILALATQKGTLVSSKVFAAVMAKYLPADQIQHDLDRFVEKGETIVPKPESLGPCVELTEVDIFEYSPGFDVEASQKKKIAVGVVRTGNAFKAGLRNGQRLKGWDIPGKDPNKRIELKLLTKGNEKTIRYLPQGKATKVPQFKKRAGPLPNDWLESCGFSSPKQ